MCSQSVLRSLGHSSWLLKIHDCVDIKDVPPGADEGRPQQRRPADVAVEGLHAQQARQPRPRGVRQASHVAHSEGEEPSLSESDLQLCSTCHVMAKAAKTCSEKVSDIYIALTCFCFTAQP